MKAARKIGEKRKEVKSSIPVPAITKIRTLADGLQKQIDAKRSPAIGDMNRTARRIRIAENMRAEGDRLANIQQAMRGIADAAERGDLPEVLAGVRTKSQVEALTQRSLWDQDIARLEKIGIKGKSQIEIAQKAVREYIEGPSKEVLQQRKLTKLENQLVGRKIPGFFPTPRPTITRLLEKAGIQKGHKVLEPSAGKGDIADVIKAEYPGAKMDVVELSGELRSVLEAKGYKLSGADFLEHSGSYDRIVMNPPFEKMADITHVRHAYNQLAPGGRVVSIMSESPFFRADKKAVEFRRWLDDVGGTSEKLTQGAFKGKGSFRQTGVSGRIVTIKKQPSPVAGAKGIVEMHGGLNLVEVGGKLVEKATPDFLKQARNRVKSKPGKQLLDKIEFEADTKWHRRAGEQIEGLREAGLNKKHKQLAESGGLADLLEKKYPTAAEAAIIKPYKKILNAMWFSAKAKGVDISGYVSKYFPRMMKKKVADIVYDDLQNALRKYSELQELKIRDTKPLQQIINDLAKKGGDFSDPTRRAIAHLIETKQAKNA
jgi:hypothetical protein